MEPDAGAVIAGGRRAPATGDGSAGFGCVTTSGGLGADGCGVPLSNGGVAVDDGSGDTAGSVPDVPIVLIGSVVTGVAGDDAAGSDGAGAMRAVIAIIERCSRVRVSITHDVLRAVRTRTAATANARRIRPRRPPRAICNAATSVCNSGRFGSSSRISSIADAASISLFAAIAVRAASIRRSARRRFARCSKRA